NPRTPGATPHVSTPRSRIFCRRVRAPAVTVVAVRRVTAVAKAARRLLPRSGALDDRAWTTIWSNRLYPFPFRGLRAPVLRSLVADRSLFSMGGPGGSTVLPT